MTTTRRTIHQKIGSMIVVVAAAAMILSVSMPLSVSSYIPLSVVSGGGKLQRRDQQQNRRSFGHRLSPTNWLQAVQKTCLYRSVDDTDRKISVDSKEEDCGNDQHLSMMMLDKILQVAVDASNKACDIIRENSSDVSKVVSKKSTGRDLLTVVDPLCEKIIRETIQEAFPHHYILGEEDVEPGIEASREALEDALEATTGKNDPNDTDNDNDGWLWIVDPIDGTTNFASGIPLSMPIIAVAYKGEVVVGVLNDPYTDEVFTTIRGRGAYCNGQKISIVDKSMRNNKSSAELADAVVGMESPAGQESLMASVRALPFLMPKVRTIRMLGSTAVFMPWVSMGRLQAYWTPDECVWDIAAGALLVQEAGGVVTDAKGNPYTIRTRSLVASSNAKIHNSILEILRESNAYV